MSEQKIKGTEGFKLVIETFLTQKAENEPLFKKTFSKENKSIDECLNYIFSTVQKSGCNGFAADEIFNMAIHYYDEDEIEISEMGVSRVVVNHSIGLTDEEVAEAKEKAIREIVNEQKQALKKKPIKIVQTDDKQVQGSLF